MRIALITLLVQFLFALWMLTTSLKKNGLGIIHDDNFWGENTFYFGVLATFLIILRISAPIAFVVNAIIVLMFAPSLYEWIEHANNSSFGATISLICYGLWSVMLVSLLFHFLHQKVQERHEHPQNSSMGTAFFLAVTFTGIFVGWQLYHNIPAIFEGWYDRHQQFSLPSHLFYLLVAIFMLLMLRLSPEVTFIMSFFAMFQTTKNWLSESAATGSGGGTMLFGAISLSLAIHLWSKRRRVLATLVEQSK